MTFVRILLIGVIAAFTLTTTAACGGSSTPAKSESPAVVLAAAKANLDSTSGVSFNLSSANVPREIEGLINGSGVLTHAPAFDGVVTVQVAGLSPKVPLVAVGDTVWAQLPLTTGWQTINPGEYGAPNPAALMATSGGISDWLTATTGVKKGDTVRGGAGNKEVLTTYSGTLAAAQAKLLVPTVATDLTVTYTVTDKHELRTIELTGDFYDSGDSETYTVTLDDYGTTKDIQAPA